MSVLSVSQSLTVLSSQRSCSSRRASSSATRTSSRTRCGGRTSRFGALLELILRDSVMPPALTIIRHMCVCLCCLSQMKLIIGFIILAILGIIIGVIVAMSKKK